jgi:hypothetical protein
MTTRQQAIAALTGPGQPYELVDEQVLGRALRVFRRAPSSLRAMYEATVSDLPFLSYQDERLSFAQCWAEASRIGHVLVSTHAYAKAIEDFSVVRTAAAAGAASGAGQRALPPCRYARVALRPTPPPLPSCALLSRARCSC